MHARTYPEAREAFFGPDERAPPLRRRRPDPWSDVLTEFRERIAPATYNAQHPGSFSYFTPPPLPSSIAGEVLAQWIHQGVDVWHAGPIGTFVEEEVTAWLRDLVGFGPDGWGVLTSGGVMANVMAMTVARDVLARASSAARRGRRAEPSSRACASTRATRPTSRSRRALGVLGFPDDTLRGDRERRAVPPAGRAGRRERSSTTAPPGSRRSRSPPSPARRTPARSTTRPASPTSPSGRACGCTSTPPTAAPHGSRAATPRACPALERADSVTVDPHKWFFQAYDIGALVVRRREDLLATFHEAPEYYASNRPEDEPLDWYQYSLEGTRRFRALKLWMSWKQLGTDGLGALIEQNDDLAAYLASRCAAEPDFEAAAGASPS